LQIFRPQAHQVPPEGRIKNHPNLLEFILESLDFGEIGFFAPVIYFAKSSHRWETITNG
jgi:hypothetical protein